MKRNPKLRLAALIVALAMLLSGCGNGTEITLDPDDPSELVDAAGQVHVQEADYVREGYYAPNTSISEDGPVVPAPASLDEMRAAAQQRQTADDYQQASRYTNIERGDINIGIVAGENTVLNPYRCTYVDVMNLSTLVFEGLMTLDANQQPQPDLADYWDPDGDTWTFYLRPGVTFQDGTLLTADDVVASYNELLNNPGCYWYPMVNQYVEGVKVKDPTTVQVKGRNGYSGYMLLYALTFPIVQRDTMENVYPIGTGPYAYVQYDTNAVRLETNPRWWRIGSGAVGSVVGVLLPTVKQAVANLENTMAAPIDKIDTLASEYPTVSVNRTLSDRVSVDYSTNTYECIVPNLNNPILKDLNVRQALMYAIDRTTLGKTVYTGMVRESEVPVLPGSWLYEPQAAKYNYNPERALDILLKSGWVDPDNDGILQKEIGSMITELSLELITYDRGTTTTRSEAAETIATQLRKVGFNITVKKLSLGDARKAMEEGAFDLCLAGFELGDAPNLVFLLSSSTGATSNYMRYKSEDMDKLLRSAYNANSAEELESSMHKVQAKIVEDLPLLGLFFRTGLLVSGKKMQGLTGTRRGYALNGLATVTLEGE